MGKLNLLVVVVAALLVTACDSNSTEETDADAFCGYVEAWFNPMTVSSVNEAATKMKERARRLETSVPADLGPEIEKLTAPILELLDQATELEADGGDLPVPTLYRAPSESDARSDRDFVYSPNPGMHEEPEQRQALTAVADRCPGL